VVPVHNEAQSIAHTIDDIRMHMGTLGIEHELIVVDDASTDDTKKLIPKGYAKVLEHECNMGYGASLKTGIRAARFPWIFIIDADGSYPVGAIKDVLGAVDESTDMVIASRWGQQSYFSVTRGPARFFLKTLAQYLTGYTIKDLNSGMRVFKKDLANRFMDILPSKFSFTTTLTLSALCNDYVVKYVDIAFRKRAGRSKISPVKDMMYFLSVIFRTVIYFNPLKVFAPLAFLLFLAAILVFAVSKTVFGKIADITVLLLFLASVQVLSIGLLADLIDKRISKE
jgi:glycosyltransferase involved in cell wall biosynthesis